MQCYNIQNNFYIYVTDNANRNLSTFALCKFNMERSRMGWHAHNESTRSISDMLLFDDL